MTESANVTGAGPSREVPGGRAHLRVRPFPPYLLAGFLVILNLVAMYGQAQFFRNAITNHSGLEDWAPAIGVALVIELIGVYLSGMAHAALMADQSAGVLRVASYGIGLLVGFLNYWHFAGTPEQPFAPTPSAVTFGALSAISPWLWSIYSRHLHRDRLAELGQVDKRGVKLSINRKVWHPVKSLQVMRFAAWEGITNPDEAVRAWELQRHRPDAPVSPAPVTVGPVNRWIQIQALRERQPGITQAECARQLGVSERTVRNSLPEGVRW